MDIFIKEEDVPEDQFRDLQPEIPPNFEPDEWIQMTNVIITVAYHVLY